MKLVKMSLAAAVAVAGLSTASFADVKMSGSADFRWTSETTGDESKNKLSRGRVTVDLKSASEDAKGKFHLQFRTNSKEVALNKAYIAYNLGAVTLKVGPAISIPGNFYYNTARGVAVQTKVAGFDVAVGSIDADSGKEMKEKSIITAKGKVSIATIRADYTMGNDKKEHIATDVKVKVGPATIIGGYAAGLGDKNKDHSIMGVDVSIGLGNITAYGAFALTGSKGGTPIEDRWTNNTLGDITTDGAMDQKADVTAMKFGGSTKVAGLKVGGYYSTAAQKDGDTATRIYVDAKKSLNTQSSIKAMYYIDNSGAKDADATNTIELRFASKF